jgi:hypothetical protein
MLFSNGAPFTPLMSATSADYTASVCNPAKYTVELLWFLTSDIPSASKLGGFCRFAIQRVQKKLPIS